MVWDSVVDRLPLIDNSHEDRPPGSLGITLGSVHAEISLPLGQFEDPFSITWLSVCSGVVCDFFRIPRVLSFESTTMNISESGSHSQSK